AATHGREPGVAGLATRRAERKRVALDAAPVDVAFETEDESAGLPVVAGGRAQKAARDIEAAGRIPGRRAEAAAAIEAEIEAAPVIDRCIERRSGHRITGREVGGLRGTRERQRATAREQHLFHHATPTHTHKRIRTRAGFGSRRVSRRAEGGVNLQVVYLRNDLSLANDECWEASGVSSRRPRAGARECTHLKFRGGKVAKIRSTRLPPPLGGRDRERGRTRTASVSYLSLNKSAANPFASVLRAIPLSASSPPLSLSLPHKGGGNRVVRTFAT